MKYFGLGIDGEMYDLCDCGDFEAAEESARDFPATMVWIADADTAASWASFIARQLDIPIG